MGFFDTPPDSDEDTAAPAEGRASPEIGPLAVIKSFFDGSMFDDSEEEEQLEEHQKPVVFISSRECTATQDALQEEVRKRDHREFVLMGCNAYETPEIDFTDTAKHQHETARIQTLNENMKKMYIGLQDFEIQQTLGQGAFSSVRLGKHHRTKVHLALKLMDKTQILKLNQLDYVTHEREALLTMCNRTQFVVQLEGVFQDEVYLCYATEFLSGGELLQLICEGDDPYLSSRDAAFYLAQVILGMECLHSYGFVHRDIKPENIIIDCNGHAKLADLGFCKRIGHGTDMRSYTSLGTPEYMAPEMIQALGHGKQVDLWTLGILLYEMLNGHPPFQSEDPFEVYQVILKLEYSCDDHVSGDGAKLIKALAERNPEDRLGSDSFIHLKRHPFLSGINWVDLEDGEKEAPVERNFKPDNPGEFFLAYPELPLVKPNDSNKLTYDEEMKFYDL